MREQIAVLDGIEVSPVPGDGQNYTGGSDWFPGAPYRLQQEGLAGYLAAFGALPTSPVPGDGQNYTGGSDWFPGAPYRLQQEGLAGLRRRGTALRGTEAGSRYALLFAQGLRMGLTREAARFRARRILGGW